MTLNKESLGLREFLKEKANQVSSNLEKILNTPDKVIEKKTSNIPIRVIFKKP